MQIHILSCILCVSLSVLPIYTSCSVNNSQKIKEGLTLTATIAALTFIGFKAYSSCKTSRSRKSRSPKPKSDEKIIKIPLFPNRYCRKIDSHETKKEVTSFIESLTPDGDNVYHLKKNGVIIRYYMDGKSKTFFQIFPSDSPTKLPKKDDSKLKPCLLVPIMENNNFIEPSSQQAGRLTFLAYDQEKKLTILGYNRSNKPTILGYNGDEHKITVSPKLSTSILKFLEDKKQAGTNDKYINTADTTTAYYQSQENKFVFRYNTPKAYQPGGGEWEKSIIISVEICFPKIFEKKHASLGFGNFNNARDKFPELVFASPPQVVATSSTKSESSGTPPYYDQVEIRAQK